MLNPRYALYLHFPRFTSIKVQILTQKAVRSVDLLSNFSKDRYDEFRQLVMTLILATDMARHVEYVLKLKQLASRAEEVSY
jgi:hypothetical protein